MADTRDDTEDQAGFSVDLDALVVQSEVRVVQSLDVNALKLTLQYVLDKLHDREAKDADAKASDTKQKDTKAKTPAQVLAELSEKDSLRQVVEQLVKDNAKLLSDVEELKERAEAQEEKTDVLARLEVVAALEERVSALEAAEKATAPSQAPESEVAGEDPAAVLDVMSPLPVSEPPVPVASLRPASDTGEAGVEEDASAGVDHAALEKLIARVTELENRRVSDKEEVDKAMAELQGLVRPGSVARSATELASDAAPQHHSSAAEEPSLVVTAKTDGSYDTAEIAESLNKAAAELAGLKVQIDSLQKCKADVLALDELCNQMAAASGSKTPPPGAARTPQQQAQKEQQAQEKGPAAGDVIEGPGDGSMELGGVSSFNMHAEDPTKAIQALKERLDALELQVSMKPPGGPAVDMAAASEAIDGIESLEELLPKIKEIYQMLESKADGVSMDALASKFLETKTVVDGKVGLAKVEEVTKQLMGKMEEALKQSVGRLEDRVKQVSEQPGEYGGKRVADTKQPSMDGGSAPDPIAMDELRARLSTLESLLHGKADQTQIESLKLDIMLSGGSDGDDNSQLIEQIQSMLSGKVTREELEATNMVVNEISDYLNSLPDPPGFSEVPQLLAEAPTPTQAAAPASSKGAEASELPAVNVDNIGARPSGPAPPWRLKKDTNMANYVSKDELAPLTKKVGDMFLELDRLNNLISALPAEDSLIAMAAEKAATAKDPSVEAAANAQLGEGAQALKLANAVSKEITILRDHLDLLAHATNILSVGQDGHDVSKSCTGDASTGNQDQATASASSGWEIRPAKGAYERLVKHVGRGDVRRKMDWFDPDVLNHLAQKVAGLDSLTRTMAARSGQMSIQDTLVKELEAQLRRVIKEVKFLRDKREEAAPTPLPNAWGQRAVPEGEHAMLSGKPLMGYKCMACDRPLEKLDQTPGPHLPTSMMPIPVKGPDSAPTMPRPPANLPVIGKGAPGKKQQGYDPAGPRGPQHWYEDQKGAAAEQLPPGDVGPNVGKGGWRASNTSPTPRREAVHAGAKLPEIQSSNPARSS